MSKCLGLYIEENLIKYAKVSKEQSNIRVESFGTKFYENIQDGINQVIQETYSQKTPISVNLSEEAYMYFEMSSLLNKKDLVAAISTEFAYYNNEKNINPNVFETRYAIVNDLVDKDKLRVIHVSSNKINQNKTTQNLANYELKGIVPLPIAITSLTKVDDVENYMIVNMEQETTVTTVLGGKIYDIEKIDGGAKEFLDEINLNENSYSKAYEIAKNTTIYTSNGMELQENEHIQYLENIMPTLYKIVGNVKKSINKSVQDIGKVYITGTAALINNVDLYFQEYLPEVDCEILKPHFLENIRDINMKDYVEVNSALSVALTYLGEGVQGLNFKHQSFAEKVPGWFKIEINPGKTKEEQKNQGGFLTWDLGQKFDRTESALLRVSNTMLMFAVIFSVFSGILTYYTFEKQNEADMFIVETLSEIGKVTDDDKKIQEKTSEYTNLIQNIQKTNEKIQETNESRNAIPNLLNQVMAVIPQNVQITSIENTTGKKVVIYAQSDKYEQLGFFIAEIKTDVILTNVISTSGQKDGGIVTIKIEGELP